jgi:hypothetical protein
MLNLIELYNFLNNKTNNIEEYINSLKSVKRLDTKIYTDYDFKVSNYSYNDNLNQLIYCLLEAGLWKPTYSVDNSLFEQSNDSFNRQVIKLNHQTITSIRNLLINLVEDDKYTLAINRKKIVMLINANQYNHELLLLLSSIFNINIFVFYKDTNLFKVYYTEDEYYCNKKSIFLQFNKDIYSSSNTLQIMSLNKSNKYLLDWEDIEILINENTCNIYPIGLNENKIFVLNKSTEIINNNFINNTETVNNMKLFATDEIIDMVYYNKIINNKLIDI